MARARKVNAAAIAVRPSSSDEASRRLARETLQALSERHEDYRVGAGDLLEISIFEWELREETKTAYFRVAESGVVALPVIGTVKVGDRTIKDIKKSIEDRLTTGGFIKEPRVSVDIREYRSKRIAVVGAVNDPGVYTLRRNVTTLLDILSLAGGLSDRAGYVLHVVRTRPKGRPAPGTSEGADEGGRRSVITIDCHELFEQGNLALNAVLRDGDVVNVPEAKTFSVVGYVKQPGSFPLKRPTTVLEGIARAGGVEEREAAPRRATLKRRTADGEEILPIDLIAIAGGREPNMYLQPDDVIEVPQSIEKRVARDALEVLKAVLNLSIAL